MKQGRILIAGLAAYAAIGLIAFGHCAAASEKAQQQAAAACKAKGQSRYCDGTVEVAALNGMMAGMLWPLYLSWELQS